MSKTRSQFTLRTISGPIKKELSWARNKQHGIHYLYHIIAKYYKLLFEQIFVKG